LSTWRRRTMACVLEKFISAFLKNRVGFRRKNDAKRYVGGGRDYLGGSVWAYTDCRREDLRKKRRCHLCARVGGSPCETFIERNS